MSKRIDYSDYIGKVFGNLTIIRRVESNNREPKWFCLCSCGANTIVATSRFKRGQKSCSICSRKNRGKPSNFQDLTGQKFGKLLVLRQGISKKNSNATWVCQCDCGNILSVVGTTLKTQKYCNKCKPGAENGYKKYNDKEKWCSSCKEWLPLDDFTEHKNRTCGRQAYCKSCSSSYRRKWTLKKYYGITEELYEETLKKQNGECAICKRKGKLNLDHCHVTGKFRGLVCHLCNVILGRFKDDVELMQKAIKYLNQHNK